MKQKTTVRLPKPGEIWIRKGGYWKMRAIAVDINTLEVEAEETNGNPRDTHCFKMKWTSMVNAGYDTPPDGNFTIDESIKPEVPRHNQCTCGGAAINSTHSYWCDIPKAG